MRKTATITVRLTTEQKAEFVKLAKDYGVSQSRLFTLMLADVVKSRRMFGVGPGGTQGEENEI